VNIERHQRGVQKREITVLERVTAGQVLTETFPGTVLWGKSFEIFGIMRGTGIWGEIERVEGGRGIPDRRKNERSLSY